MASRVRELDRTYGLRNQLAPALAQQSGYIICLLRSAAHPMQGQEANGIGLELRIRLYQIKENLRQRARAQV